MVQQFKALLTAQRAIVAWRRQHSLTANEAAVLLEVMGAGAIGAADLSRAVGITTASMSTMLARLEREGWIMRSTHETDGRRLHVQPSKALVTAIDLIDAPEADGAGAAHVRRIRTS